MTGRVLAYPATRRRAEQAQVADPGLVHDIKDALAELGGEAHRSLVVDQVARRRGVAGRADARRLAGDVIAAFERALRDEEMRRELGFHLVFGPGSHRWGLQQDESRLA